MPKTNKCKCLSLVIEKKTKRKRRCRKYSLNGEKYCFVHKINNIITNENEYSQCCYCNNSCNISSQTCGRCARIVSLYGFEYLFFNQIKVINF